MALSISSHPLTSPSSSSTSYSQLPKSTVPRETLIALRFQRRSPLSFGHLRHSLGPMNSQRTTCHASPTTSPPANIGRVGEVKRVTKETDVSVRINLDGSGEADSSTGIPFLDHMLDALLQALGDRRGINRFGDFSAPLDEALIHVSLDLSGRPHLSYGLQIPTQRVGTYDTQGKKCCTSFLNAACENEYYCLSSCFLAFYNLFPVIIKSRELIALAGGALFPVSGQYFWYDTPHPADAVVVEKSFNFSAAHHLKSYRSFSSWKKFSPHN
ncbi:imidazoleglycerol-phosphate dehydratase, chloroplastic isoform X8 [Diospyros lotus]|uniref:imidazoleglycerol-phosphate dehydratase, chloroplastic isoform X8 n=1 Tax=Diospyros lotus TaxID=55363 RepID=UPI0022591E0B|nr:imidazoleglycerol-phosphate dehydratase, chloroplastic isoform X8 [Diospyros lotus]